LPRNQFDAGERTRKDFDERHIKLRKLVTEFALNSINDFKVRYLQMQTLTFTVNSDVLCYE